MMRFSKTANISPVFQAVLLKRSLYKPASGKQQLHSEDCEMQNAKAQNQLQEILELFRELGVASRMQVHWGRYLCIMIASLLENAVQAIYRGIRLLGSGR